MSNFISWNFRHSVASVLALGIGASALSAEASPLIEIAGGVIGDSGHNGRFTGSDASAAYFNPANLSRTANGINVGILVIHDSLSLRLGARDAVNNIEDADRTVIFNSGQNLGGSIPLPTQYLYDGCANVQSSTCNLTGTPRQSQGSSGNTRAYASLGFTNKIVDQYLHAGFYALLPLGTFTQGKTFFADEREQYFSNSLHPELMSDRLLAPSLAFGLSSSPIPNLTLGLSFTIALLANAQAVVYTPEPNALDNSLLLSLDMGVVAKAAPHFAIAYDPIPGLRISGTVHSPSRFDIDMDFGTLLQDSSFQIASRRMTFDYNPWMFGLGVEYVHELYGDLALTLTGGITYELWSNYVDRYRQEALPGYEWSNTVTPSIGARLGNGVWTTGLDLKYVPTPIPVQTGRTNYVGNNKALANLLFDYRFTAGKLNLGVGANFQAHFMQARMNTKLPPRTDGVIRDPSNPLYGQNFNPNRVIDEVPDDTRHQVVENYTGNVGLQTNNPGWPWFESTGFMFAGSAYLSIYY